MNPEIEYLKKEYLEAVRLYLWYTGSPYSFHQGKTSKVEAERYRYLLNYFFDLYSKKLKASKE